MSETLQGNYFGREITDEAVTYPLVDFLSEYTPELYLTDSDTTQRVPYLPAALLADPNIAASRDPGRIAAALRTRKVLSKALALVMDVTIEDVHYTPPRPAPERSRPGVQKYEMARGFVWTRLTAESTKSLQGQIREVRSLLHVGYSPRAQRSAGQIVLAQVEGPRRRLEADTAGQVLIKASQLRPGQLMRLSKTGL